MQQLLSIVHNDEQVVMNKNQLTANRFQIGRHFCVTYLLWPPYVIGGHYIFTL